MRRKACEIAAAIDQRPNARSHVAVSLHERNRDCRDQATTPTARYGNTRAFAGPAREASEEAGGVGVFRDLEDLEFLAGFFDLLKETL